MTEQNAYLLLNGLMLVVALALFLPQRLMVRRSQRLFLERGSTCWPLGTFLAGYAALGLGSGLARTSNPNWSSMFVAAQLAWLIAGAALLLVMRRRLKARAIMSPELLAPIEHEVTLVLASHGRLPAIRAAVKSGLLLSDAVSLVERLERRSAA